MYKIISAKRLSNGAGGSVQIQIAVNELGQIEKLAPVRFDSDNMDTKTISVLKP